LFVIGGVVLDRGSILQGQDFDDDEGYDDGGDDGDDGGGAYY
jgi:hypothetical protein